MLPYILISYLSVTANGNFANSQKEEELSKILKRRLTRKSPPAGMINDTVFVYLDVYQIVAVDEKNSALTLKLWVIKYYRLNDSFWDPSSYDNVKRLQFPVDTFWIPDLG